MKKRHRILKDVEIVPAIKRLQQSDPEYSEVRLTDASSAATRVLRELSSTLIALDKIGDQLDEMFDSTSDELTHHFSARWSRVHNELNVFRSQLSDFRNEALNAVAKKSGDA